MVIGKCELLCPKNEADLRIKEKILNYYEYENYEKRIPGTLVKSFSRSAAGIKKPLAKDLRTESCLNKTLEYLLRRIVTDKRRPFCVAYDFIFDRLRAVRQEIVIQEFDAKQTLTLLQPIVIFLAYSLYRLCEESIDKFDRTICEQHFQECLKRCLVCYDANEVETNEPFTPIEERKRGLIEGLYQIFNLGKMDALRRCLILPAYVQQDENFILARKIAMSYNRNNIYRVLNGITDLPHVLCAVAALNIQKCRRKLLESFANAYHSKKFCVPLNFIRRLTKHDDEKLLSLDCIYFNMYLTGDNQAVQFNKTNFNTIAEPLKPRHEKFVEDKFINLNLSEVLLLKKF